MDDITAREILNIVAFSILMEDDNGIIDKSPDYIMEKFQRYCQMQNNQPLLGLNDKNRAKWMAWTKKWLKK